MAVAAGSTPVSPHARPEAPAWPFAADRPLVLVTDYSPHDQGGGAVILRSLLARQDPATVRRVSLTPGPDAGLPVTILGLGSLGRLGRRSIALDLTWYRDALARELADLIERERAAAVWLVLHGAVTGIAARLGRWSRVPMHLSVHDDPAFATARRSRKLRPLVGWIDRQMRAALRSATSVDAIGEAMAARYRNRYGVQSEVLHRALDEPIESAPNPRHDELSVAVLGNPYAFAPLRQLADAVALAAAELNTPGRVVIVGGQAYGEQLRQAVGDKVRVDVLGHLDESAGVTQLRQATALVLNYPFGRGDAVLRQTSFPTKLSTYLLAARPILVHAPPDSSTIHVARLAPFARAWTTTDPRDGARALIDLWEASRQANPDDWRDRAASARDRWYDPDRQRAALIGIMSRLVGTPS